MSVLFRDGNGQALDRLGGVLWMLYSNILYHLNGPVDSCTLVFLFLDDFLRAVCARDPRQEVSSSSPSPNELQSFNFLSSSSIAVHFSLVRLRLLSPRLLFDSLPLAHTMDKIVSQYTRSPHQNEFYSEREQQELTESLPPISLKFNLPPLDNVSWAIMR